MVSLRDARTARSVHKALLPDNVKVPKGMNLVQVVHDASLVIRVSVDEPVAAPFETLISTLDEFVSHIYTITQTLDRVEILRNDRHKDPKRRS